MPRTVKTSNTSKRKSPPISYKEKSKKHKSSPQSPSGKKGGKKSKKKAKSVSPVSPIACTSQAVTPHVPRKKRKKNKKTPPSVQTSPQPSTSGAHLSPTSAQQKKKLARGSIVLPRRRGRSSSASSNSSSSSVGIVHERRTTHAKRSRREFRVSGDDFSESDFESGDESPDEHELNIQPEADVDNTVVMNDQDVPPEFASTDDDFVGFVNVPDFQTPPRNMDGQGGAGAYVYGGRSLEHINSHWQSRSRPQMKLPFTGKTGFREYLDLPPKEDITPKDIFDLFVNDEDYEIMAVETNRYATQYFGAENREVTQKSRFQKWKETNASEIKVFLGLIFGMAVVVQRDMCSYWTTDPVGRTPFFSETMPRDRFKLLMSMFHLADKTKIPGRTSPNYAPMEIVGQVYKNVIHRFSSVYYPHQQLAVDEGTIPWKGNLRFKCYNPLKPKKYGLKAYMLCDAVNAYCCKFEVYTGKLDITISTLDDLMLRLLQKYLYKGHHLFMDNFYSSPLLYCRLASCQVGCTGTVRKSRKGIPADIKDEKVKKNSWTSRSSENLLLVKYHDKKEVYLMSTVCTDTPTPTGKLVRIPAPAVEDEPDTQREEIMMPHLVGVYNKYMNGVDRSDQMVSYYALRQKTMKWWKRLIFHVLNVAVVNSYILYKEYTGNKKMTHRQFRVKLIEAMVDVPQEDLISTPNPPRVRRAPSTSRMQNPSEHHFNVKLPISASSGRQISRRCRVCSVAERKRWEWMSEEEKEEVRRKEKKEKKQRKFGHETSFECDKCRVPLCTFPCFQMYHTEVNFSKAYLKKTYNITLPEDEDDEEEASE